MAFRKKIKDEGAVSPVSFKRTNANGYEEITPIRDEWETSVQIAFTSSNARIVAPETRLEWVETDSDNAYEGILKIKKGFHRIFFEKKGSGYSSVAGDYYVPEIELPIKFEVKSFGNEKVIKRQNGFKTEYIDRVVNALEYLPEEITEQLSASDKIYFSNVSLADLREDFVEYMNSKDRPNTPYNLALWTLGFQSSLNIFEQKTEPIYIDVPTGQYENAKIYLTIGDTNEAIEFNEYSTFCKQEFSITSRFNYKDLILAKLKEEGWK
ncbi:MAG: hypothetical protein GYA14_08705 [Ignavibacteria bacterium]|nr:hypothetical protein [Ignavibacteria bacterium]